MARMTQLHVMSTCPYAKHEKVLKLALARDSEPVFRGQEFLPASVMEWLEEQAKNILELEAVSASPTMDAAQKKHLQLLGSGRAPFGLLVAKDHHYRPGSELLTDFAFESQILLDFPSEATGWLCNKQNIRLFQRQVKEYQQLQQQLVTSC
jgi:hypothetical protein